MRLVQILVQKLLAAVVLIVGVLLVADLFTPNVQGIVDSLRGSYEAWPDLLRNPAKITAGILLIFMGVLGLLPAMRMRRGRQISFDGPHGEVAFDLDSVAATLGRVVGKMDEVNKITVHVLPVENYTKADISAEVVLNPPNAGARQAANHVHNQMQRAAVQILGADQVSRVGLTVKRILINTKRLRDLPDTDEVVDATAAAGAAGPVMELQGLEEAEREMHEEFAEAVREQRAREEARREAERAASAEEVAVDPVAVEPVTLEDEQSTAPVAAASDAQAPSEPTLSYVEDLEDTAPATPQEPLAWDESEAAEEPLELDGREPRDTSEHLPGFTESVEAQDDAEPAHDESAGPSDEADEPMVLESPSAEEPLFIQPDDEPAQPAPDDETKEDERRS